MNPYLEQESAWHTFHERFCTRLADELVARTSARYYVKLDENVFLHELPAEDRRLLGRPDVMLLETRRDASPATAATSVLAAPAYANLPSIDVERLTNVEIRDSASHRLITAIELLSPTNKRPGSDRTQYLAKRGRLLAEGVNLVEIDLLRGGPRMPADSIPACDYLVMVARASEWPRAGLWPVQLREPLPIIPIPLAEPDPDIPVKLQELFQSVYAAGGYDRFIYSASPEPPLDPRDREWANGLVGQAPPNSVG